MYKNVWCTCIVVLLIKALSTRIRFHLKTQIFLYGYDFHPHVSDKNDQWKRSFSKTLSRVELSENAVFTCTCGQTKTELTVNPLLSPTFQRRKVNKPPVSIKSPPLPLPSIRSLQKQLTCTEQLWFIQAGNSYCFWSSTALAPTSCAELFQLYALVLCGELLPFSYC